MRIDGDSKSKPAVKRFELPLLPLPEDRGGVFMSSSGSTEVPLNQACGVGCLGKQKCGTVTWHQHSDQLLIPPASSWRVLPMGASGSVSIPICIAACSDACDEGLQHNRLIAVIACLTSELAYPMMLAITVACRLVTFANRQGQHGVQVRDAI